MGDEQTMHQPTKIKKMKFETKDTSMLKKIKIVCMGMVCVLVASQSAFSGGEQINLPAQENLGKPASANSTSKSGGLIGFGPDKSWQIHPGFEFKSAYDSNINREPQRKRNSDVIFDYIPSIELKKSGSRLAVDAGYKMDYQEFITDTSNNHFNQEAFANIKVTGERLKASVDEKFAFAKAYASSEQSKRRLYLVNDVRPELSYRLTPKVSIAGVYQNYIFDYKDAVIANNSYTLNDFGGRVYYHATPKLDFYVQGTGTVIDYYRSGLYDAKGFSVLVGSKGKATNKLLVDVQTGYKGHFYDNSAINSYNTWVFEGMLQYKVTPKLLASLVGKRDKQESVYRAVGWYQAHRVGLDLNYKYSDHIFFGIDQYYQRNGYASATTEVGPITKRRVDHILESGARIKWLPVQHLIFALGYVFRNRDSNFDNLFDYVDHTVETSISYKF